MKITALKKVETVTMKLAEITTGKAYDISFNKENQWTSQKDLPSGKYKVKSLSGPSSLVVLTSKDTFEIDTKNAQAFVNINVTEEDASYAPLNLLKNNAFILLAIAGCCVALVICKKKGITMTGKESE
jgi:hypothetical protein